MTDLNPDFARGYQAAMAELQPGSGMDAGRQAAIKFFVGLVHSVSEILGSHGDMDKAEETVFAAAYYFSVLGVGQEERVAATLAVREELLAFEKGQHNDEED